MIIFISVLCYTNAMAVGESAVTTLDFPAGAENTGLGETGVSFANTPYSIFWNPANAACLYEETYLNQQYTKFNEQLLPSFKIPDLTHSFTAFSTTLNDVFPHIDIGYGYYRNHFNMGASTIEDSLENEIDTIHSSETVTANCFGIRGFDILSFGFSIKEYDSQLVPGIGGTLYPKDGTARGNAFDIGLRANKKFEFKKLFFINPAIGVSILNFGGDSAKYVESAPNKEPLPKKGWLGGSCEFNALDIFEYTFIYEADFNLVTEPNEKTTHIGHKFQITPFYALLRGSLNDSAGERYENSEGYVVSINLRKTYLLIYKIIKLFDYLNKTNNSEKLEKWDNSLTVHGFDFKPNIFYSKSHSVIHGSKPDQFREGQTRNDWSIGIGIISGFPNY
jgi:hypothetical protein